MNLSAPFIQRPVMTTLLMVAVLWMGFMAFRSLPVSDLPDVDYPVIVVQVGFPGASPETMANTIALPLEKEFMSISGLGEITSSSGLGTTTIFLQFNLAKNVDAAALDVQAAIIRAKTKLPSDLPHDPTYLKVNPAAVPIMYFVVASDTMPLGDLAVYADTFVAQRLSGVEGVARVAVEGAPYAIRVQVNPDKLSAWDLSLEEVSQTIQQGNVRYPTGQLDGSTTAPMIIAEGELDRAALYDPLIIAYRNEMPVRIRDVGKAVDSVSKPKQVLRYFRQGQEMACCVVTVQRQSGANAVAISEAVHNILPDIQSHLPGLVHLELLFDRSESIRESVSEAEWTLLLAFLLVALVIFLYLGRVSYALIPILVMPLSLAATFPFMYLLGYTIDNLSALAFILAMGFIIDDAIVVLENVVRLIEEGRNPWSAALEGARRIGFTIISMTLSLVATFIPLALMGGLIGKIFQEFAVILIVITCLSGVLSLSLSPMLCSVLIRVPDTGMKETYVEKMAGWLNRTLLSLYQPCLRWTLDHAFASLAATLATLAAIFYLIDYLPKDFLPNDEIGFILGYTEGEEGTSSKRMAERQAQVIDVIGSDPNVESVLALDAIPQYYEGAVYAKLKPKEERLPLVQVMQNLHARLDLIPGINTYLRNIPSLDLSLGVESKGSYQYMLQSLNPPLLYRTATRMLAAMSELPGFQEVSSNLHLKMPQLRIEMLRDEAASLGVSVESIERSLQLAYSGDKVSTFANATGQYDVILELDPEFQKRAASLDSIYVRSRLSNKLVPLNAVARWKEEVGPSTIQHLSQFPAVTISFNLTPGVAAGEALGLLNLAAERILPSGVSGKVTGSAEAMEDTVKSIPWLFGFAILTIYIVLGILYESFIHPLTVISTLPSAVFGGLATLAVLELPLSLYAALGLFMLIGIVKKNGIMVVDYAIEGERARGRSPREAVFEACVVRFRPIMMTTLAAVMGAVPIVLATGMGAEARQPLGWVIVGGLLVSQLITLFVTPVFYLYLAKWHARVAFKKYTHSS